MNSVEPNLVSPIGEPLWMDDSIIVFSKPSGLLTIQDGYRTGLPFLANIIAQQYGRIWVVHRLDRETSGIILFARSAEIHRQLNRQFQNREVKKLYRAIVRRRPAWDEFQADFPLRVNGDRLHRTVIDPLKGKPAASTLRVLHRYEADWSLITVEPHSGYTHQIRAHAAWLGHPVANDHLYQVPKQSPFAPDESDSPTDGPEGINRLALHAASIEFQHPAEGRQIRLQAPDPIDFTTALEILHSE